MAQLMATPQADRFVNIEARSQKQYGLWTRNTIEYSISCEGEGRTRADFVESFYNTRRAQSGEQENLVEMAGALKFPIKLAIIFTALDAIYTIVYVLIIRFGKVKHSKDVPAHKSNVHIIVFQVPAFIINGLGIFLIWSIRR